MLTYRGRIIPKWKIALTAALPVAITLLLIWID